MAYVTALPRLQNPYSAVAPAVIKGMLAGICIMIFASQFHVMLELTPSKSGIVNLLTIPGWSTKA
jgi:MFS superfamily sulfate permease-like transporter